MDLCVSLDFDGVIVDTISLLYDVYRDILMFYNIYGNKDEFEHLNGSNMDEVADHLINTYKLSDSKKNLLDMYYSKLNKMYENANLNHGVAELLEFLDIKRIPIALVSGCSLASINTVTERLKIKKYFKTIVSGDDVRQAKPAKDIYEFLKKKMPRHVFLAIEDSYNGILSAKNAGINVVYYDNAGQNDTKSIFNSHYTIHNFEEMDMIIYSIQRNIFSVTRIDTNTKISFEKSKTKKDKATEQILDGMWADALKQKADLFNGKIACYNSSFFENNSLHINICDSDYKHFLFKEQVVLQSGVKVAPLAVSGIIIDNQNNTLIGTRNNVTQYDGYIELIPSGGIEYDNLEKMNEPKEQILIELLQEVGIDRKLVRNVVAFCLVHDKKDDIFDIGFKIHLDDSLSQLLDAGNLKSDEYTNIRVINIDELKKSIDKLHIAPPTVALLCHN